MDGSVSTWESIGRVWAYRGEGRANFVRIVGIACFYAIELVNYHGLALGAVVFEQVAGVDQRFHAAVTALTVAWVASAVAVMIAMRSRRFPPFLKYAVTTVDVLLLTAILLVADGPKSPLVIAYFVVLAAAPLRASVGLVRYTTAATIAGYVVLVGDAFLRRPEMRVPRYEQVMVVVALLLAGLALSTFVKSIESAAAAFAARKERPE